MKAEPSIKGDNQKDPSSFERVFNNLFNPVPVISSKEEAMRSNRNMLRQLVEREDIRELLNVDEKSINVPIWRTALYSLGFVCLSILIFRRPLFILLGLIVAALCFIIESSYIRQNYPKKLYNKIREIAGTEEHFMVLEQMLGATGYQRLESWKHKSNSTDSSNRMTWFVEELKNFEKRDREERLKENLKENAGSMKVDLLRNIHK